MPDKEDAGFGCGSRRQQATGGEVSSRKDGDGGGERENRGKVNLRPVGSSHCAKSIGRFYAYTRKSSRGMSSIVVWVGGASTGGPIDTSQGHVGSSGANACRQLWLP